MIERYQLRYFLAVVEAGTFSRAARQVNVTQPTLSVGIAKLEAELGGPLFIRNSRRVELTPAGARLLPHARAAERELGALDRLREPSRDPTPVRLGVVLSLATHDIEAIVTSNAALGSPDALELVEGTERELIERLKRRRIDLAVLGMRTAEPLFRTEPLRSEGYVLAVSHAHRLAGESQVAPERLASEVMMVRRSCEALSETSRYFTQRGVRPRFSFRSYSEDRVRAMVRAGLGVTVAPESWGDGSVSIVRLKGFVHRRALCLAYAEGALHPPRGDAVVSAIRQVLG